jgi:hypothetical protein
MSARNHKKAAEKILAETLFVPESQVGTHILAIGQLRATLYLGEQTEALAKQQRLANLISWLITSGEEPSAENAKRISAALGFEPTGANGAHVIGGLA